MSRNIFWLLSGYVSPLGTFALKEKKPPIVNNQCVVYKFECYGGPQLSHQNQMLTANYKSLTANSNRSQQIQIAHSKFKSLTANSNRPQQIQIVHSKFKSSTANSNRPQQIQIAHRITRMITDQIGFHSVLLPLLIIYGFRGAF